MTLKVTSATGPNGTVQGLAYDGFGRLVRSTVTPPGGTEGALSSLRYDGFELFDIDGDGIPDAPSPGGRKITQKVFTNAVVPPENAGSAPGRITTTFFDKLGRTTGTDIQLGDTYQNQPLVVGHRTFDALGRIRFAADPYSPAFNSFPNTTYGTTYNYNTDGTPSCFVRGTGPKPASAAVSDSQEVFPTCFSRSFDNNQEIGTLVDANNVGGIASNDFVSSQTTLNAIGRVLDHSTLSRHATPTGFATETLEDAAFSYNALGQLTSMTRYQDPINKTSRVTTTWHPDSLGQVTKLEEPGVAPQTRTFDSWGELTQVQWCNDGTAGPCPGQDRLSLIQYDSLGRVIHREDKVAGTTRPLPSTITPMTWASATIRRRCPRPICSAALPPPLGAIPLRWRAVRCR